MSARRDRATFVFGLLLLLVGAVIAAWAYYWEVLFAGWPFGTGTPDTGSIAAIVTGLALAVIGIVVLFRSRARGRRD